MATTDLPKSPLHKRLNRLLAEDGLDEWKPCARLTADRVRDRFRLNNTKAMIIPTAVL